MITLEAVTVCIGYADFLAECAAQNRCHFDRWIVVTTARDRETRAVCARHAIDVVLTDEHTRDGDFSKGRLINRGLAHTTGRNWLLHIDGDIVLPSDFRTILDEAHIEESSLYGCDRVNVVGYSRWEEVKRQGLSARSNPWMVRVDRGLSVGARVANVGHGYTPIGFFQLWHGSQRNSYPIQHGTAARTDVQHALHWDRRRRVHIPELIVWHLESEKGKMGANWSGRTTKPFGPGVTVMQTKEY